MSNNQKKASILFWVILLLGCWIATSGCSVSSRTELKASPKPITYPQDLIYPMTGYELDKVVTLELECCECCGFARWTDSWCERHFGT
jgi:hypothetical protein